MKEGWKTNLLLKVCKVYQPQTIATSQLIPGAPYDVFGANGCIGKYDQYNHEEDEILLTCRGATCGNINRSTPKSWINGNAMVVHPISDNIIKDFLMYALKSIDFSKVITGAAQPQITRVSLASVTIPIPPLPEQERIVSLLDAEFAKIDAIKANAEKQLQDAKALFQSAIDNYFTPKEGWINDVLGGVGDFFRGGNFTKSDFVDEGIPCIHYGQIHMKFGAYTTENLTYLPHNFSKVKYAQKGDLIIAITSEDNEGSCKCTAWLGEQSVAVGGHIAVFRHQLDSKLMAYYFRSKRFQMEKINYTHGFKVVEIKPSDIAKISISYPPSLSDQQQIAEQLDKLSAKIQSLQSNFDTTVTLCNDLKQSILKDIFG